mgnify:CR=1 FL=1
MLESIKNKWESLNEKQRQVARALLILSSIFTILLVVNYYRQGTKKLYDKKGTKIDFSSISGKGKIEDVWLESSELKLSELQKQIAEEKKDNEELKRQIEDLAAQVEDSNNQNQQKFQQQLEQLRKENSNKANQNSRQNYNEGNKTQNSQPALNDPFARVSSDFNDFADANDQEYSQAYSDNRQIDLINFSQTQEKESFDLDNYLPAGSYVKAVLISAVDASVSISSQSDPRPVLFRIIDNARSAVDKNKQLTVNVKGCTVTGAAYGD